jgi:hypothetical protein
MLGRRLACHQVKSLIAQLLVEFVVVAGDDNDGGPLGETI